MKDIEIYQPIGIHVLIKPDEAEDETTTTGFKISQVGQQKPRTGTVIKTGVAIAYDGKTMFKSVLKPGDKVWWAYGGFNVELDGETYLSIKEPEILGFSRKEEINNTDKNNEKDL